MLFIAVAFTLHRPHHDVSCYPPILPCVLVTSHAELENAEKKTLPHAPFAQLRGTALSGTEIARTRKTEATFVLHFDAARSSKRRSFKLALGTPSFNICGYYFPRFPKNIGSNGAFSSKMRFSPLPHLPPDHLLCCRFPPRPPRPQKLQSPAYSAPLR